MVASNAVVDQATTVTVPNVQVVSDGCSKAKALLVDVSRSYLQAMNLSYSIFYQKTDKFLGCPILPE